MASLHTVKTTSDKGTLIQTFTSRKAAENFYWFVRGLNRDLNPVLDTNVSMIDTDKTAGETAIMFHGDAS